jgi:NADP-dependent aldehyde dehydrogenase
MASLHGKNFIGRSTSVHSTKTFTAFNPAAGKPIDPPFHEATGGEVGSALQLAASAFERYRQLTPENRASFLDKIADAISDLGDTLLGRAEAETGLPRPRLEAERARTVGHLHMFAALVREGSWIGASIDTADPDRKPQPKPDLRRMLVPIGPVAVFGASNFPLAYSVAGGDTASALAAGCPVIVKAHPAHPGTCELVASAIISAADEAGMPDGVFSMVHGQSNDVGMALVEHPLTAAV